MRFFQRQSRRLGIVALLVGAALLAGALVAYVQSVPDAGDPAAIEESLTRPTPPPQPVPAPDPAPAPAAPVDEPPLWKANDTTLLADLDETSPVPVGLSISVIDVEAPIDPHGVDPETGLMDVPDNVTDVGWYRHGPRPGESGSAVLAAHVDLRDQGPGVFFDLDELQHGDRVVVRFDDRSRREFVVTATSTYLKTELPLDAVFSRSGPAVLTLITCGGVFDADESRYDSNVVVYATPVTTPTPTVAD